MINFVLAVLLICPTAFAYVPTVESLFRNGGNPDAPANTATMTLKVTKLNHSEDKQAQDVSLIKESKIDDFYKLFITLADDESLKVSQTRYANNSFSEASLEHKVYHPDFTAYTLKPSIDQIEKGMLFSLIKSLTFNDGGHLVTYLKQLGVPVRLNDELINREKIEYLASYKKYLIMVNRDRKKNEQNPLRPDDPVAREKVQNVMGESMYVDTKQVKLTRDNGNMAWMVSAGAFEGVVSYERRQIQRLKYKSQVGEFEIICHDYWLANGTHSLPKYLVIRSFNGETYQVNLSGFRYYKEEEKDLNRRLEKWDQILTGKEPSGPRPEFLL